MDESESTTGTSNNFLMMPSQESAESSADATYTDNQADTTEEPPHEDEAVPENTATTEDDEPAHGCEVSVTAEEPSPIKYTPMPKSPVECTTERTSRKSVRHIAATPSGLTKRNGNVNLGVKRKEKRNFV